ncbi:hypothetical protein AB4351_08315 [Vibrio sp. 10N.261.51.F11]|uniref:hypothetical protein n=1 Tax=Vibrio sp. 10N.261.51.F11 TaxID=3229678 RepID=UPI0035508812
MSDFLPEYEYVTNYYKIGDNENVEGTVAIRVPIITPKYIDTARQDTIALPNMVADELASRCNYPIGLSRWTKQFDDVTSFLSQRIDFTEDVNQFHTFQGIPLSLDYFFIITGAERGDLESVTIGEILLHLRRAYACLCENDLEFAFHLLEIVSTFRENLIVLLGEREQLVGGHQIAAGLKGNSRRSEFTKQWVMKAQELADQVFQRNPRLSYEDCAKIIREDLTSYLSDSDFDVPGLKRIAAKIKKN